MSTTTVDRTSATSQMASSTPLKGPPAPPVTCENALANIVRLRLAVDTVEGDLMRIASLDKPQTPMVASLQEEKESWNKLKELLPCKADCEVLLEYLIQEVGCSTFCQSSYELCFDKRPAV